VAEFEAAHLPCEQGNQPVLVVVLAAFDEAEAIGAVVRALPGEVEGHRVEAVVVDDGSTDDTACVAAQAGALVVRHAVNRGQGAALRTGFTFARGRGADVVVTMDADGQHRPEDLPALVRPIVEGDADYVQGSRFLGAYDDSGSTRELGIRVLTLVVNAASRAGITDCANGFRAVRADRLGDLVLFEDRFSASEIIIEAARRRLRILEVPVHVRARTHGESKKPRSLRYPLGFLRVVLRVWWR
jgi:glycosyltransferase involved in cell wall biosynthesis